MCAVSRVYVVQLEMLPEKVLSATDLKDAKKKYLVLMARLLDEARYDLTSLDIKARKLTGHYI
jgi:hypothetical protein